MTEPAELGPNADPWYDRATQIVGRRLLRIARMALEGKLTTNQAVEATHAAESPGYYRQVVLLLKRHPSETYAMCLVKERARAAHA